MSADPHSIATGQHLAVEEAERRATLLVSMSTAVIVTVLVWATYYELSGHGPPQRWVITLMPGAAAAASILLVRVGRVLAGSVLLTAVIWACFASTLVVWNSIFVVMLGYFIAVLVAGFLLGSRGAIVTGFSSLGFTYAVLTAREQGLIGPPEPTFAGHDVLWAVVVLLLTASVVASFDRSVRTYYQVLEQRSLDLARGERRYQSLTQTTSALIVEVGPDARVRYANPAALPVLGLSPADMLGTPIGQLLPKGAVDTLFQRLGESAEGPALFRHRARHADGTWRHLLSSARGWEDETGTQRTVVVSEDITDRATAEEHLRRTQAELIRARQLEEFGRLVGGVAHDLNNLLSVMSVAGELLEDDPIRRSHTIHEAATRAGRLTSQLRAFSGQGTGPEVLDLDRAVTDLHRILQHLVGARIELLLDMDSGSAAIHMDPIRLEQVIINLTANARDAMREGGELTVRTARDGGEAILEVEDSGSGIDPQSLNDVFTPYFTTKADFGGTGIGLATVHEAVQDAGGRVQVRSTVGVGTCFTIRFPALPTPDHASRRGVHPDQELAGGTETILFAEDAPGVRNAVSQMLRDAGYQVVEAVDGQEAIERFTPGTVDLILADMQMPRKTGLDLAEEVRVIDPSVKILFASAYLDGPLAERSRQVPNSDWLAKPFTRNSLLTRVRALLDGVTP